MNAQAPNPGRTLKQFSIDQRFGKESEANQIARLNAAMREACDGAPRLVIVRGPDIDELAPKETKQEDATKSGAPWGKGVGVTALLQTAIDQAREIEDCEVWSFLDEDDQEVRTEADDFFNKEFIAKRILNEAQQGWRYSFTYHMLRSFLRRAGMFLQTLETKVGLGLAAALCVCLAATLGLDWIAPIVDPKNDSRLDRTMQVLNDHPIALWIVSVALIAVWWRFFKGRLDDTGARARWDSNGPGRLQKEHLEIAWEELQDNPGKAVQFLPREKPLLIVIDDIDSMDNGSVNHIFQLFEGVQKAQEGSDKSQAKYRICLVLGFNPQNLDFLADDKKSPIRKLLSKDNLKEQSSWRSIMVTPLKRQQLTDLLEIYFGSSLPNQLINAIEASYPEASKDTGQLLGLFVNRVDGRISDARKPLSAEQQNQFVEEFGKYMRRDAEEVDRLERIVKNVCATKQLAEVGVFEFLKYIKGQRS